VEGTMSEFNKSGIKPGSHGTVRVSVPSKVFYDLEKMQAATKEILGRLGCSSCHSGFDIRFRQESEFRVNVDGRIGG
jgi:hypothetical protein